MNNEVCKLGGCDKRKHSKGYCCYHYNIYGRPLNPCKEKDCNKNTYAKDLCRNHYAESKRVRTYKYGVICQAPDCHKSMSTKNLFCSTHALRAERGLPLNERISTRGENNPNWNGGVSEYHNHYVMKKARLEKLKQIGCRCEECGKRKRKRNLQIHHLDESKDNHSLENLKLLCPKCHLGIYHKGQMGRKLKVINGFTCQEIADNVGCSLDLVYRHIRGKYKSKKYGAVIDTLIK